MTADATDRLGQEAARRRNDQQQSVINSVTIALSALSVIVALVATVLVSLDNRRLADLTAEANRTAQEAQRASVVAARLDLTSDRSRHPNWTATVIVENTGSTPTRDLQAIWAVTPYSMRGGSPNAYIDANTKSPPDPTTLTNAGAFDADRLDSHPILEPRAQLQLLGTSQIPEDGLEGSPTLRESDDGSTGWFFYGTVGYQDVFQRKHVTKFCWQIFGVSGWDGYRPLSAPCRHWNCTDAECDSDRAQYQAEVMETARRFRLKLPPHYFDQPLPPPSERTMIWQGGVE